MVEGSRYVWRFRTDSLLRAAAGTTTCTCGLGQTVRLAILWRSDGMVLTLGGIYDKPATALI